LHRGTIAAKPASAVAAASVRLAVAAAVVRVALAAAAALRLALPSAVAARPGFRPVPQAMPSSHVSRAERLCYMRSAE